jgi:glycerate dehydrogenase
MNICILDGSTLNPGDLNWAPIEQFGELSIYDRTPTDLIVERSQDADILIVNKVKLTKGLMAQMPKLRLICISATGFDNVDIQAAKELGIAVSNVKGYSTTGVAQHVFAQLLSYFNQAAQFWDKTSKDHWTNSKDFCFYLDPIEELAGKRIGIYGFGQIGQQVAKLALAFGMEVSAVSKYPEQTKMEGVQFVSPETLIKNSEIITLHIPLTPSSLEMVDNIFLDQLQENSILINTGRGGLINEQILADYLNKGRIRAAFLDVLSSEPPQNDNPLLKAKNCFITPHVAWASLQSRQRLMQGLADNIDAFYSNKSLNRLDQ